jgi:hypothetical protein
VIRERWRAFAVVVAVAGGVVLAEGATAPSVAAATQPIISFPLGDAPACPVGWLKRTAHQRVDGAIERYVACWVPAIATRRLGPPSGPVVPLAESDVSVSVNWSGYIAAGGGPYRAVSAEWTVPRIHCGAFPVAATALWVGIGGYDSPELFQAGTLSTCAGDEHDYAWFTDDRRAYLPVAKMAVRPGDVIYAIDWQVSSARWQYLVDDITAGRRITSRRGVHWLGVADSAEWITEDPGVESSPDDLADYGTATFANVALTAASPASSFLPFDIAGAGDSLVSETSSLEVTPQGNEFSTVYVPPTAPPPG